MLLKNERTKLRVARSKAKRWDVETLDAVCFQNNFFLKSKKKEKMLLQAMAHCGSHQL
jgi:hypothetical protein